MGDTGEEIAGYDAREIENLLDQIRRHYMEARERVHEAADILDSGQGVFARWAPPDEPHSPEDPSSPGLADEPEAVLTPGSEERLQPLRPTTGEPVDPGRLRIHSLGKFRVHK